MARTCTATAPWCVALVISLGGTKEKPDKYAEYLPLFVKDVRQAIGKPELPTVIVGTGIGGRDKTDFPDVIKAQQATAALPEFKDTVAYVETRDLWPPEDARESYRHATHEQWYNNAKSFVDMGEAIAEALLPLLAKQ